MAEYMEYSWRAETLNSPNPMYNIRDSQKDNKRAIAALRELISTSTDSEIQEAPYQDDKSLLRFLYARKFDVEQSYRLLLAYQRHRRRNPNIFANLRASAPDVQILLEDGLPGVLPNRDRKGRRILLLTSANWERSSPLVSIYRSLLVALEHLTTGPSSLENIANGFVVIVDWTGFPFTQSSQLTPSVLKVMIEGFEDCFPARFKGVHFINQPWYVEAALVVIRRFMREDTAERIFVHGNNLSTLHEHVPQDVLPAELGGECRAYDPGPWLKEITTSESSPDISG